MFTQKYKKNIINFTARVSSPNSRQNAIERFTHPGTLLQCYLADFQQVFASKDVPQKQTTKFNLMRGNLKSKNQGKTVTNYPNSLICGRAPEI